MTESFEDRARAVRQIFCEFNDDVDSVFDPDYWVQRVLDAVEQEPTEIKIDRELNRPATCKVWRDGVLIFDGRDYSADVPREQEPTEAQVEAAAEVIWGQRARSANAIGRHFRTMARAALLAAKDL